MREYVELVCGPMLEAVAPYVRWPTCSARPGFDADQSCAVLTRRRQARAGPAVHGNRSAPAPGWHSPVELGAASVDHCTY